MFRLAWIYWDPKPEFFILPLVQLPILWYGVFFSAAFFIGFALFKNILIRYFLLDLSQNPLPPEDGAVLKVKRKAMRIADRLTVYMIVATLIGARLGHFIFYENPSSYLKDPWEIFRVWEGGLASHGAAIAIILAVILFSYRIRSEAKGLDWVRLLDFLSIPAALAGSFIRLGNFFNQEILGKPSNLPWAVLFGHPADHSARVPRHPVQIYESIFYLGVFFLLWRLSYRPSFLVRGKLIGIFLVLVFGFRFFIEFLKMEQSNLISSASFLTMGQYLSLPLVLAGFVFYFWKRGCSFKGSFGNNFSPDKL